MNRNLRILSLLFLSAFATGIMAQCPTSITANAASTNSCEGTDSPITVTVTSPATPPTVVGGQANPNPDLAVPDGSLVGVSSTINVAGGVGTVLNTTDITVTLNIPNNWCSDMDIYLVGPGNCGTMELSTDNGGSGKDYIGTVISTNYTTSITTGIAPFTGNFAPEGAVNVVPALNSGVGGGTYALPAVDIAGCPINGVWTLWVFDDVGTDLGFIDSWSLSIGNCQYSYTYSVTAPATVTGISSTTNTMQSNATVSNLPIGVSIISCAVSNGTATTNPTTTVKKFDTPVITLVEVTPNCVVGPNATVTVNAQPIINANFTGADIGVWQYSINGTTWLTSNTFSGLSAGSYTVRVRNSAFNTCQASQVVVVIGAPTTTPAGTPSGVIKLCEATSGATSANLSTQATGGPPGLVTYGPYPKVCTSNCVPLDNNTLPCPPWMDSVFVTGAGSIQLTSIVSVLLNIDCDWFSDLDIWLVGPGNCGTLDLSTDNGGTNDDFQNVTVTTQAGFPSITTIAPAVGTQLQTNATFMAENAINAPPILVFPGGGTSLTGNSSSASNSGNLYPSTPCLGPTTFVPNAGLQGCPVTGWWKLVIADDWVAISGTVFNWALTIQQSDPNYQHLFTTTEPGVTLTPNTPFTGLGLFGFLGTATASNLPIGYTDVYVTASRGGCTSPQDTFYISVYDRPTFNGFTATCASAGFPGSVTINASLNNGDFVGADIGVVQYASTLSGPWTNLTGPITGLAAGTNTYYLRNSASPGTSGAGSCTSGPFTVTIPSGAQPNTIIPTQSVSCTQTTITLSANQQSPGPVLPGASYVWSPATNTTQTYTVTPTSTTQYCVTVTNTSTPACTTATCTTVNVDFTGSGPAPTVLGDSVCISGNVTLDVTSSCVGGTLQWFTTPTGGTPVFTGDPFTTSVSGTTTYYVQCVQGPCVSARGPATAQVFGAIATPTFTVVPNPVCVGTPAVFTVTAPTGGLYVYEWFVNGVSQGAPSPSTTWNWASPVDGASVTVIAYYYF